VGADALLAGGGGEYASPDDAEALSPDGVDGEYASADDAGALSPEEMGGEYEYVGCEGAALLVGGCETLATSLAGECSGVGYAKAEAETVAVSCTLV